MMFLASVSYVFALIFTTWLMFTNIVLYMSVRNSLNYRYMILMSILSTVNSTLCGVAIAFFYARCGLDIITLSFVPQTVTAIVFTGFTLLETWRIGRIVSRSRCGDMCISSD